MITEKIGLITRMSGISEWLQVYNGSKAALVMTTSYPVNKTESILRYNDSMGNYTMGPTVNSHWVTICTLWGLIAFIGAVGNIIVIFTMCRQRSRGITKSATNCYIINVALTDLAFLIIVVPVTVSVYMTVDWNYGDVMCKINFYITYVTLLSTCLTLTAMTIDRYFAIVHPIRSLRRRTQKSTFIICIGIWIASLVVCSPYLKFQEVDIINGTRVCKAMWPAQWDKISTIVIVIVTYVIPLSVIVISYTLILKFLWRHRIGISKECNHNSDSSEPVMGGGGDNPKIAKRRKKVAKMVAAVVILFALTWFPIHLFNLCFYLIKNFPKNQLTYNLKVIAHTLSYTNSCVNPFVYTIMGDSFRKAFWGSIPICRDTSSGSLRPSYSKRTGSTVETRFNGD